MLELALIGRDEQVATSVLPRLLLAAQAGWMLQTTADNLERRQDKEDTTQLQDVIAELRK